MAIKARMPQQLKGFILDTHVMILKDSMLRDATVQKIMGEKINAEWALKNTVEDIREIFTQIDDEYIRERIVDVEGVAERILSNLSGEC